VVCGVFSVLVGVGVSCRSECGLPGLYVHCRWRFLVGASPDLVRSRRSLAGSYANVWAVGRLVPSWSWSRSLVPFFDRDAASKLYVSPPRYSWRHPPVDIGVF
jgi:hypothetical protein